jgi:aryl-alcohol dehydrogenase-like predicted oxidoreductase
MRYTIFGRSTGLRVSTLALGTGAFGTAWGYGAEPEEARRIFEGYAQAGGNFIDTADSYQFGQSESLLGDFLASTRDDFVLATKYSLGASAGAGPLATGNSRRAMIQSVEQSLRRLKTDRIDLYWVHMADGMTPIHEVVRGLDDLVRSGKILYAGLSDFPAWQVSQAATLADLRGFAPIAGLQIEYSLVERTPDRELLPMARDLGLGTVTWSPLGGGLLTGKYRRGETGRKTEWKRLIHDEDSAQKTAILDTLEAVARETGAAAGHVAIAWIVAKGLIPILGPRSRAQLDDNLAAAALTLDIGQIRRLDEASAVSLGFPHALLGSVEIRRQLTGGRLELYDPSRPQSL